MHIHRTISLRISWYHYVSANINMYQPLLIPICTNLGGYFKPCLSERGRVRVRTFLVFEAEKCTIGKERGNYWQNNSGSCKLPWHNRCDKRGTLLDWFKLIYRDTLLGELETVVKLLISLKKKLERDSGGMWLTVIILSHWWYLYILFLFILPFKPINRSISSCKSVSLSL